MFTELNPETVNDDLYIQEDDICYNCKFNQDECPLVAALTQNLVIISDDCLPVDNCFFYEKREEGV